MPKTSTVLQVFVSSPGDLAEERALLEDVVQELNLVWRTSSRFQLELVSWETDTRPGLGKDPQSVINEQIGDNYDIFVGLMGARFGTATGRAGSGTEEEFEIAHARFQRNPKSISVMFYFKDSSISISKIDPHQLLQVLNFKERMKPLGLFRIFNSKDEFAQLMRIHLTQEVQSWSQRLSSETIQLSRSNQIRAIAAVEATEEEEGLIELNEKLTDEFDAATEIIAKIGNAVKNAGSRTEQRITEIEQARNEASAQNRQIDLKTIKRHANSIADDLDELAARLNVEIPLYSTRFNKAIAVSTKMVHTSLDFGPTPIEKLEESATSTAELATNISQAVETYRSLRNIIAALPRMTTTLNRSKRKTVDSLDRLIVAFEGSVQPTNDLYELILRIARERHA